MSYPRLVVIMQVSGQDLVITRQFKKPAYIGDPLNAVRIFNAKQVDELVIIDITATEKKTGPALELLRQVTAECLMPLTYGGGVSTVEEVDEILRLGVEKISFNQAWLTQPQLITDCAKRYGNQSMVASIDVKRRVWRGYEVYSRRGKQAAGLDPVTAAKKCEDMGVGEILLQSIDCDGMRSGYDLELIRLVQDAVSIPVVAAGGAKDITDMLTMIQNTGAAGAAAGRLFVYYNNQEGILINWPGRETILNLQAQGQLAPRKAA